MIRLCVSIFSILIGLTVSSQSPLSQWNEIIQYIDNENFEESIISINKLLDSYHNSNLAPDSLYALAIHKKGVANYYLDSEEEAISSWKEALSLRQTLYSPNHLDIIKGHRNIATSYLNIDQLYLSKQHYQMSLDLHNSRNEKDDILFSRANHSNSSQSSQ